MHVEQISNALRFSSIPQPSRIILPNLRITRGEDLITDQLALVVQDTNISDLILLKSRGEMLTLNLRTLEHCVTIGQYNWNDILLEEELAWKP